MTHDPRKVAAVLDTYRVAPYCDAFIYELSKHRESSGLDLMMLFELCDMLWQAAQRERNK